MSVLVRKARGPGTIAALLAAALICELGAAAAPPATETAGTATILEINGAIGPATSRYVVHGLETAQKRGTRVVVLQMDTPGGLDSAMRDIIRAILASPIPVVAYVSPSGARAAGGGAHTPP